MALISVFIRKLFTLIVQEKLRVFVFSLMLFATSAGVWIFFLIFWGECSGQLTCSGAGCSQGGISLVAVLPLAWGSYILARAFTSILVRFKW